MLITLNFELTWGGTILNMADHCSVGLAALDAALNAANRWIFTEMLDEDLQPWDGVKKVPSETRGFNGPLKNGT